MADETDAYARWQEVATSSDSASVLDVVPTIAAATSPWPMLVRALVVTPVYLRVAEGGRVPFTGNGFTKSGDDVIPEYAVPRGETVTIREGAEMWEITDSGSQRLVAVLRTLDGEPAWIPQGN